MRVLGRSSLWVTGFAVLLALLGIVASFTLFTNTPVQAQGNNRCEDPYSYEADYEFEGETGWCVERLSVGSDQPGVTCPDGGQRTTGGILGSQTVCVKQPNDPGGNGGGNDNGGGNGNNNQNDDEQEVKCSSNTALSWIMCPVLNAVTSTTGRAAQILEGFLYVNPLTSGGSDSSESLVYEVWKNFRNLANVLFIFVMFGLIYSQATSTGISAFGIKKMLPKLIAAGILANLSFFLCAIAVDIFNVLGAGISDLILSVLETSNAANRDFYEPGLFGVITGAAGELATGLVLTVALIVFLVTNFSIALLLVFVAILTLALRQALIIFLTILAPVAFALWVLPNTEQYFQKWYKLFFSLLLMYPLMMALFAAAKVAAVVVRFSAENSGDAFLASSLAVLIAASPFVLLPTLFQVGNYSLSKINQMAKGTAIGQGAQKLDKAAGDAAISAAKVRRDEWIIKRTSPNLQKKDYLNAAGTDWNDGDDDGSGGSLGLTEEEKAANKDKNRRAYKKQRNRNLYAAAMTGKLPTQRGRGFTRGEGEKGIDEEVNAQKQYFDDVKTSKEELTRWLREDADPETGRKMTFAQRRAGIEMLQSMGASDKLAELMDESKNGGFLTNKDENDEFGSENRAILSRIVASDSNTKQSNNQIFFRAVGQQAAISEGITDQEEIKRRGDALAAKKAGDDLGPQMLAGQSKDGMAQITSTVNQVNSAAEVAREEMKKDGVTGGSIHVSAIDASGNRMTNDAVIAQADKINSTVASAIKDSTGNQRIAPGLTAVQGDRLSDMVTALNQHSAVLQQGLQPGETFDVKQRIEDTKGRATRGA